jgi:hypothetical protein
MLILTRKAGESILIGDDIEIKLITWIEVMKSLALLFGLFSVALSSGCATGVMGETVMGRPGSPAWHISASIQTKISHFKGTCMAYGIADGTQEMANCLQSEIQNSKNRARSKINALNTNNAIRQNNNRSFTCRNYGNTTICN